MNEKEDVNIFKYQRIKVPIDDFSNFLGRKLI